MSSHFARALAAALFGVVACADADPSASAPTTPFAYVGACAPSARVGGFEVTLTDSFTAVSGHVESGVAPASVLEPVASLSGCRLTRAPDLFCDPACGVGMTCGPGGACVAFPAPRDVGLVRVSGLAAPVSMAPTATGKRYFATELPHPGFAPGAEITLVASGADIGGFRLRGWGVSPLAPAAQEATLARGQDLVVGWAPAEGPTRVWLTLQIDEHGLSPGRLVCEVDDSGAVTVPAGLVDQLVDLGVSGYPRATLARRTADRVDLASGCVDLTVSSEVELGLAVAGHVPCARDEDCPAGRACELAVNTCRQR